MERENWERRRGDLNDFLGWFDGYFISGLEGVIKPKHEYFERALERLNLQPDEVLFIDDRPDNTAAAAALGIPAVVFSSPEALRGELVGRGLLAPGVPPGQSAGGALQDLAQDPRGRREIEAGEAGPSGPKLGSALSIIFASESNHSAGSSPRPAPRKSSQER